MCTLDFGQTAAPSSSRFERVDLNVQGDNPPLDPIPGQRLRVGSPEIMTGLTDRAAAANRRIIYIVKTHGWHVMKIMPKSQDPGSAFTIGLFLC